MSISPALLFIPDISGFTQFVKATDIAHSQHIIEELLEALIEANDIGLEVSEVEGDAILFYRFGAAPTADELFRQVRKMFIEFHGHLRLYERQRICQCGACASAQGLTLKIVAHYAEVTQSRVKEHVKLFGPDLITVHRLLKNDIPHHEYALVTSGLTGEWTNGGMPDWGSSVRGIQEYDIGTVEYQYTPLAPLRDQVPEPQPLDFSIEGATKLIFQCEQEIDAPMDLVFDTATDLTRRVHWMEGAKDVELLNDKLNRVGTKHRCIVEKNNPIMVTSRSTRTGDSVSLAETDDRKTVCSVYTLRQVGEKRTRLSIDGFVKDSFPLRMIISLLVAKKLKTRFQKSSENLKRYCEERFRVELTQPNRD